MNPILKQDFDTIIKDEGERLNFLNGKSIFITGGTGLVLSYLVKFLLYRNESLPDKEQTRITFTVRDRMKYVSDFRPQPDMKLYPIFKKVENITEDDIVAPGTDYIIHGASPAKPSDFKKPQNVWRPNIEGTLKILSYVTPNVKNILFLSAGEIYGQPNMSGDMATMEHDFGGLDCAEARSAYPESKRMAEQMIMSSGFPCKIARLFHTYGPGVSEKDRRIFADIIWAAVNKKDIVLNSDGCATRAFLYLQDATIAFLRLLAAPPEPAVYNIGNQYAAVTMQRLASDIAERYGVKVINKKSKTLSNSRQYFVPDCGKARIELGWEAKVGYMEGFERTIKYYLGEV